MDLPASSFLPTAAAAMLRHHGIPLDDAALLHRMHAPFLFLRRNGRYIAGRTLFTPEWLHLSLQPLGLSLVSHTLPKDQLLPFLQAHTPCAVTDAAARWLCVTCANGRSIHLTNLSEQRRVTFALLLRHLPEIVEVITLEKCPAAPVDLVPLLLESLHTLSEYHQDVLALLPRTVTREDMAVLHPQYFRALMTDPMPLLPLYQDDSLAQTMLELHHQYRRLLLPDERSVLLQARLSQQHISRCITWMQEHICDHLYELGVADDLIYPY